MGQRERELGKKVKEIGINLTLTLLIEIHSLEFGIEISSWHPKDYYASEKKSFNR